MNCTRIKGEGGKERSGYPTLTVILWFFSLCRQLHNTSHHYWLFNLPPKTEADTFFYYYPTLPHSRFCVASNYIFRGKEGQYWHVLTTWMFSVCRSRALSSWWTKSERRDNSFVASVCESSERYGVSRNQSGCCRRERNIKLDWTKLAWVWQSAYIEIYSYNGIPIFALCYARAVRWWWWRLCRRRLSHEDSSSCADR